MPVYNGRPYLDIAIESVLDQTYTDFEFIIVDDGSTDGSTEVLRHYASRDNRMCVIRQENIGVTASRNRGLQEAEGEYIAWMDDDDVSLPERFARQVAYLDDHPDCVALGGQVTLIDQNGSPVRNTDIPPFSDGEGHVEGLWEDHRAIEKSLLEGEWPIQQSASMLRREAVESVGGYDERFATNQDHDLFLKLAEVGQLANLQRTVVKYRRHRTQITANQPGRNFAVKYRKAKIRREAYQRRGRPLPDELRLPSVAGILFRRLLSKTALWPYVQSAWSALRGTG